MFRHYTIVQLTIVIVIPFDYLENPDEAGDKVNNKVILTSIEKHVILNKGFDRAEPLNLQM